MNVNNWYDKPLIIIVNGVYWIISKFDFFDHSFRVFFIKRNLKIISIRFNNEMGTKRQETKGHFSKAVI